MLAEIDLMLRGAVIGIAVLIATLLCCDRAARARSWSVIAMAVALTGDLAVTQGMTAIWSPEARDMAFVARAFMPLAMTWFILDIFLDRSEYGPREWGMLAFAGVVTALCLAPGTPDALHMAFDIVLFGWVISIALGTARGDLVDRRRRFRVRFVTLLVIFGIAKTTTEFLLAPADRPEWLGSLYALGALAFTIVFARWALTPDAGFRSCTPRRKPAEPEPPAPGPDRQVLTRIETAMRDEMWRRENLTIGQMATELAIPEHRLRRAINGDLGHRNFSSFVNGYRIAAARSLFDDPANAGRTVLEIAYEVGFASLGPFNRAFRSETGQSPTDYRRGGGAEPVAAE